MPTTKFSDAEVSVDPPSADCYSGNEERPVSNSKKVKLNKSTNSLIHYSLQILVGGCMYQFKSSIALLVVALVASLSLAIAGPTPGRIPRPARDTSPDVTASRAKATAQKL